VNGPSSLKKTSFFDVIIAAAMPATLVLLRCDRLTGEWVREGRMTFDDDAAGLGAERARVYGEAWVSESSDQRREYSVLTERAPLEG
jgi:hypothetical protein